MTGTRPLGVWLAPALVLALGVIVILFDPLGVQSILSNTLFDAWQRHLPAHHDTGRRIEPLDLPALDEDSLVRTARAMATSGARLVLLAAPLQAGASPQSIAARLPPGEALAREALARLPEPGHDLAAVFQQVPGIVPVTLGVAGRPPHIKARFIYQGTSDPFGVVPRFDAAAAAPALLESNAAGVGADTLAPDADGVVRRMPLVLKLGGGLVPGLAAETLRVLEKRGEITVTGDERDPLTLVTGTGVAGLQTRQRLVPADRDGAVRLHFAAIKSARIGGLVDPDLKDAIIVVGPQGATVKTPLGMDSVAGVIAQGIESLFDGQVLTRPFWLKPLEALLLALAGAVMVLLLRFGLGWTTAFVFAVLAAMLGGSWYLFAAHSLLADAATPALMLALAFAAGATAHVYDLRLAYIGLRTAFADSLPRATIEKIARRPSLLNIAGENRVITYLVCGMRGHAALAKAYEGNAAGFTNLMQRVLTPLIDQALAHGGTIDRLTADGFACFWNAPLDDGEHALHACEAANGMAIMSSRVTELLAQEQVGEHLAPMVEIGVGLGTGPVVAGAFGGAGRLGYSVNGDVVVMAQRIQALSHTYGPALIVAEETRKLAERGFAFLEIDTIADEQNRPVTLYAIMGNPVMRSSPKFRALTVFHDHIFQSIRKQNWAMARELIAQCRRLSGASQKLYDLHLNRIAWYEKHPPGADWDGAFRQPLE
jgi:adenylate cyclase